MTLNLGIWVLSFLVYTSALNVLATPQKNITDDPNLCKVGTYYKNPEFYGDITKEFFTNSPAIFAIGFIECGTAIILNALTGPADNICGCDCHASHFSSRYELCAMDTDFQALIGCRCVYTQEDWDEIPCNFGWTAGISLNSKDTGHVLEGAEGKNKEDVKNSRNSIISNTRNQEKSPILDVCSQIFQEMTNRVFCDENVSHLISAATTVNGLDLCQIDCFYTHGARRAPFGGCAKIGGESKCICFF